MDSKTWGKLGSTGTSRGLQTLQHQQLSSSGTRSVYPGGVSTLSSQTASHWQRVACCSSLSGSASSQSQLLSHQPQQNQVQQQQTAQLRYFRVQKSGPKFPNPVPSSAGQTCQHFAQHYALLTSSSPSSPSTLVSSGNPLIPERTSQQKCETHPHVECYFNPCQSSRGSSTISQSLTLKPAEEGRLNHHHLHHPGSQNNQANRSNQQRSLSALSPAYQPRYQLIAGGNFAIPAAGVEVSLTTCFDATSLEASVYSSTSSCCPLDQVSSLPRIIPAFRSPSLPRFVNAFEAVPDMLRDIRPGSPPIAPRSRPPFPLLGQPVEFSYHASKPQLSVSLQATVVEAAIVGTSRDRNWPELSLRSHRPVTLEHLQSSSASTSASTSAATSASSASADKTEKQKTVWRKIALTEEKEKFVKSTTRRILKQQSAALGRKTYAAAVQVTGSQEIREGRLESRERSHKDRTTMSELMSTRLRIQEARRVSNVTRASGFLTSTPNKSEPRGMRKKREYEDSCEEDCEYSSTSTVSSGTNDTLSRTPEGFSSPEGGTLTNWRGGSSSSSLPELDEDKEADGRGAPSRKRLCKMAESFCFGQLENEAFFRAFDEYNRRRRRMSYTQKLEDAPGTKSCNAAEAMLDRRVEIFGKEGNPIFQNLVYAALQQSQAITGQAEGNVQIRLNGIEGQGAFKVLQKLKECADGTGALYTNSWRPEELHFLRRCYQNKNV